jgi:mutator protein MutT
MIVVTAAVIEQNGHLLVTRRLENTHLAGTWEFPGGKCEPGEDHDTCLRRELREELGVDARIGSLLLSTTYRYPARTVQLHFYRCEVLGTPEPLLGQQMQWVTRAELKTLEFPPADAELIGLLESQDVTRHEHPAIADAE